MKLQLWVSGLAVALMAASSLVAQEAKRPSPGQTSPGQTSPGQASPGQTSPGQASPGQTSPGQASPGQARPGQTAAGSQRERTAGGVSVRASQLTGMNIQNSQGKSVGEISDLVIDTSSGKVRYAAVTYGGFLGIGNKMFAVPFEAFRFQRVANNPDQMVLVLDVTQNQLEGAVGFDENSWPNFGDQKFTSELDTRYKVNRDMRERGGGVDVGVDRNDVDVKVKPDRDNQ